MQTKQYLAPYFTNGAGWTVAENQWTNYVFTGFVNHRFQTEKEALMFCAEKEMQILQEKGWTKQDFARALKELIEK